MEHIGTVAEQQRKGFACELYWKIGTERMLAKYNQAKDCVETLTECQNTGPEAEGIVQAFVQGVKAAKLMAPSFHTLCAAYKPEHK